MLVQMRAIFQLDEKTLEILLLEILIKDFKTVWLGR